MAIFVQRFLLLFGMLQALNLSAQHRIKSSINTNWRFYKGDIKDYPSNKDAAVQWQTISLPHSWNTTDVNDDEKGYYRGVGWYTKRLFIPASWGNKEVSLYFEGASQVTEVYVNGKKAGAHTGGYAFFNVPIKQYLNFGSDAVNEVAVKVDNKHDEDIPPLSADFTFFGGIYRDVYLVATDAVHFDVDNNGSSGVFVTTPRVSEAAADVHVSGAFVNQSGKARKIELITRIADALGKTIAEKKTLLKIAAGEKLNFAQPLTGILKPALWSPEQPYLYRITSSLVDAATKQALDEVINPLGFRWFSFDAEKGFFLNGKHYKLMGASRHQDYKDKANALPDAMHVNDVQLLKNMGANFLRVAHYPQDPEVLQACDRLGILASVETPVVNRITETTAFAEHCKTMQVEMIRQNFNHPSVIIWAYMNEVLLRPRYTDEADKREQYFQRIAALAQQLEDITRKEDPSRYTMIPNHGAFELYNKVGLTKIPMLVGWNLYQGWYSGDLGGFAKYLDKHREVLPDKPFLVTEYGADADPRVHSMEPVRFDKSNEYAVAYHKVYIKAVYDRPFVAGAIIWNLADFNSEERAESMPHINNKGITTIDRQPKDTYWLYKATLSAHPFVAIGSGYWSLRSALADAPDREQCTQPVEVYSNLPAVSLRVNGKDLGTVATVEGTATFQVPFTDGENHLQATATADGNTYADNVLIRFKVIPHDLRSKTIPFTELNVSLGDKRYIVDAEQQQVWVPEKPYQAGSWGYVGGDVYKMKDSGRLPYGSDKNIVGTDNDPMYETQRYGIEQFKLDVPDGSYEVTLHFAELVFTKKSDELAYNLTTAAKTPEKVEAGTRAFDVMINDTAVLENLSNSNYLEPDKAYSSKVMINVTGGKGISILFKPVVGEAVLNGLQVRKLY